LLKVWAVQREIDSKKKRNKKKKGNQGKNAADVTSIAGEAASQNHNHELAPIDHHKGSDADDVMSSVGEELPQYKNHQPNIQADYNGTSAYDTTSSIGECIACYQNNEPMMTQENHKASNAVPADQRSVGLSESSVELDMHRLHEAKLVSILLVCDIANATSFFIFLKYLLIWSALELIIYSNFTVFVQ
jgi:hypothetical protein